MQSRPSRLCADRIFAFRPRHRGSRGHQPPRDLPRARRFRRGVRAPRSGSAHGRAQFQGGRVGRRRLESHVPAILRGELRRECEAG